MAAEFKRSTRDAIRSVAKYMSVALGDEWEVRFHGEEHEFKLPFCLVSWAGDATWTGTRDSPMVVRPIQIDCYPFPGDTVEDSLMNVEEVEETMFGAIRVGVGDGRPERLPFYNYGEVPLGQTSDDRGGGHPTFLRVVPGTFSQSRVADPTDDRWIRSVSSFRLSWHRFGERILGRHVELLKQEFNTPAT